MAAFTLRAQQMPAITGKVQDSITKAPLPYATVSLFLKDGSSPLKGVLTTDNGSFKLDNVKPGDYKVTLSFVGYPAKTLNISVGAKDSNLGTILLAEKKNTLKEVAIVGQQSLVENKIDKMVYSVEKDITASGGTATDVLGKVPMVSVDMNGNVSVRGDQNVRVMINGKSTGTAGSVADLLRSIPADQIKSIEVITSPSAKYDAEGSAGILNIVTKQKNVSGISGSVNGGVGTRQNNGNLNLNYNAGKFHSTINAGGFASWPQTSTTEFNQQINSDTIHTSTSTKGSSRVSRHAVNTSFSAGYDFDTLNSINTSFKLMRFHMNNDGSSQTIAAQPYNYTSVSGNTFSNFDWNLDYTHKFHQPGHEISVSGQWSHGTNISDYTNVYTAVFSNLQNNISGINNEYTVQADYTLPINKMLKLEAGGKSIMRRINSTSDYFRSATGSNFVFDPTNSNVYRYNQDVFAGYGVLTFTLPKKWSVLAGIRDENTDIHGDPQNATQGLTPFSQNYNTFVPSLTLQKQLANNNTIKAVYSKRISRPSLQFLNPFIDQSSPQSQSVGNTQLNPEISHTYELDYNAFFGASSLNMSVYYRHTTGLIEGIATPISITVNGVTQGGTLTKYQNIGENNSIGASLFGSVTPVKLLTLTGNINGYTYKPDPAGIYSSQQSQNKTYLMYNGFVRGTLNLSSNLLAEVFGFGGAPRRTIQGSNPAFAMYGLGVRRQFMQKKMSIGINATQPFADSKHFDSKISSPGFTQTTLSQVPFRSFGLTFSYSFGKLSFAPPTKNKINNDDLKQGDQGQGQGGGPR